jgi:hypothetical protein
LVSQGHFVRFAFLEPVYAELRYLVSTRERFSLQRRAAITRLKSTLELVFPEFERLFPTIHWPTPLALLARFPGPEALLAAPKRRVLAVLKTASRNHLGMDTYAALRTAADASLGLPLAQGAPARELPLVIEQLQLYERHLAAVEQAMVAALAPLPEAAALRTIPGVQAVTAAESSARWETCRRTSRRARFCGWPGCRWSKRRAACTRGASGSRSGGARYSAGTRSSSPCAVSGRAASSRRSSMPWSSATVG